MKQVYSEIIQFRGTHYDFGYLQGKKIKDSLIVKNRENQWKVRKPRFQVQEEEVKEAVIPFAPGIWDELLGMQSALEWPMDRILMEFGGYRLDYVRSGCSILTGEDYLIRNYDYHPKTYEGRYTLFQPTDKGYAIIGPSQRVTGRMDGMNEKGLVIGYNFMHRKNPGDGFICCMIGRFILESCANVHEAVEMLKEIPHRHSFTYVVFDQSGESIAVETSPRRVEVRKTNMCTNHFEIMKHENRNHLVDSKRRLEVLCHHQEHLEGAMEAFRLLNDTDKGVFSNLYGSWAGTIHTSGYLPRKMEAWFALGGDHEPVKLDFAKWLSGEDLSLERMIGTVDTDIPFVHMDEGADWFKS
ncbi:C45 family autoproteolytic acyltransferase/hydrolase [Heyndrickxia oleronia]|uniref:Acyl-CoA--6-aminopenicillanic acid acyltransferase n=1 Tax=Heyndrickxia oleronia TaxID=38875 RepID=A0A8E2LF97_9BACI|nr:C45 family peptidase [Heyndrickxia oleronia]MEC1373240.1 C45 family autoproteolytic acyltransferase/hydrolase [Heyndrickxia oleronia]OOP67954.1 acyl-CoA--6-aminopenicillanic acid acyltransferase [Heyndrickxia oleronia]QQZ04456.1 linear amide C-N hydrolase [Heyndrickxia oleronia]